MTGLVIQSINMLPRYFNVSIPVHPYHIQCQVQAEVGSLILLG